MIGEDVEKLKQLILIEEISNWVPEEMRIYLKEDKLRQRTSDASRRIRDNT